ncbi:isoprenoid synthase domain-containing protein [Apiospora arundinis]|uniref:Isoprenoid synthase domain-containing protein n=1 Tax=Apiospora arundinis TaxID=335852 RepID=A0ABR2HK61_9PEZI
MPARALQLEKIAAAEDLEHVIPVVFSWNYIPRLPPFLVAQDWSFDNPIAHCSTSDPFSGNCFPIDAKAAGFPYHTGLTCLQHNRHWKAALDYASELCELVAADKSYNSAKLSRGGNLATIAKRELKAPLGERFVTFAINLFPKADEERMKLIAVGILFVVMFDGMSFFSLLPRDSTSWLVAQLYTCMWPADRRPINSSDSWEEAPGEDLKNVQDDFVARMRGEKKSSETEGPATSTTTTPLQARIDEIVALCRACDERTGTDAGHDFIERMLEWVMHSQPEPGQGFASPREYLDYRWMDAADWWLAAACKLSIASPISLVDPVTAKLLRLAGDHISIVNDLGSFDKERAAFESGRTVVFINLVQVLRTSCGLSVDDAKAAAFVLQLLNEQEMLAECEHLKTDDRMTDEHWRFVDVLLLLCAGNTFYTMTTSRYGGEAARIKK